MSCYQVEGGQKIGKRQQEQGRSLQREGGKVIIRCRKEINVKRLRQNRKRRTAQPNTRKADYGKEKERGGGKG